MKLANKLIIFDFDGTLVHFPFEYMFSETDRILNHFAHEPVRRFELEEAFSDFDYFRFIKLSPEMPFKDVEEFKASFWKCFDWDNFPKSLVFKETIQCLRDLKKEGGTLREFRNQDQ